MRAVRGITQKIDNVVNLAVDTYAFATIADGTVGDRLTVQWLYDKQERARDANGELLGGGTARVHVEWQTMYNDDVQIVKDCDGKLIAYSQIPKTIINQYRLDEGPLGMGGDYQVTILAGDKKLSEQAFNGFVGPQWDN